ncbi:MAG: C40 family peptidase, partial [Lachnospiraceae bacterium]|nr:C40 family peptidase [Lachnospiraceae bacterium]
AEKQAKDYAKKIKKQNEEIRKLEKQKEAERKKAERENNGGGGDNSGGGKKHQGSEYELDPSVITGSYGSEEGKQVALYAIQFLGNPYKAGGTSLTDGTDCSGFTMSVYKNFGISIPRTSYSQRSCGVGVDYADAQPGDIICYSGHVGLYVGQGLIVHASSAKTGIKISKATYRTILAVRRVV